MSTSILVAYATLSGSTQQVAETIAVTLRERGLNVDCQPVRQVRKLDGYSAVVLGAPLYMFHWNKDALGFLSRNRQILTTLPVAIFALGPFHNDEKEFTDARAVLDKELVQFPWLSPIALEMFGGKFDPKALRFPYNLIPALKNMPPSDARDWDVIRTWTNDLASKLESTLQR